MDIERVEIVKDRPTLFSVCFQYPNGEGGNLTTTQSAASELTAEEVTRASPRFAADGVRSMALAAPEVSLEARYRLLELATANQAFRAAALTSSEMVPALRQGFFSLVDLVSINEDEAGALTGRMFDPADPFPFLNACSDMLISCQPSMRIVISAGKHGAFAFSDGLWDHCPAAPATVVGTAGAGDALLGAILSGLAVGMPLICPGSPRKSITERSLGSALDFAVLLASFTITSPHTIHPYANLETLLQFAAEIGVTFSDAVSRYL
jgi:sugar/nucleoside kinase (ribokinase family)